MKYAIFIVSILFFCGCGTVVVSEYDRAVQSISDFTAIQIALGCVHEDDGGEICFPLQVKTKSHSFLRVSVAMIDSPGGYVAVLQKPTAGVPDYLLLYYGQEAPGCDSVEAAAVPKEFERYCYVEDEQDGYGLYDRQETQFTNSMIYAYNWFPVGDI